jgi:hypothetical protein
MAFDDEIERLRKRIAPLATFLHAIDRTLDKPTLSGSPEHLGFRYKNPQLIHFCLLRGARIVSALNASIELARCGYSQEIGVILRTMIEYASQIDFLLASLDKEGKHSGKAARFLEDFFADHRRPAAGKRFKLIQKDVHDIVGTRLDEAAVAAGEDLKQRRTATELLSSIYLVFSNYVHGRYPESMDLYGGRPGSFHVHGMSRTPKDTENLEILDTLITTASNSLKGIAIDLELTEIIKSDPILSAWISNW